MPQSSDDNSDGQPGSFFERWSRRKSAVSSLDRKSPIDQSASVQDTVDAGSIDPSDSRSAETDAQTATNPEAPPPVSEADLENLTYDSDYTRFMGEQVPEALRRRALRQLWRSDPILANVDGLCDYDDDYTDAALAVTALKTIHKVGQGYLTDEEVAANRARGEPTEPEAETDAPHVVSDSEPDAASDEKWAADPEPETDTDEPPAETKAASVDKPSPEEDNEIADLGAGDEQSLQPDPTNVG